MKRILLSLLVDAEMASSIREDHEYQRSRDREEKGRLIAAILHSIRLAATIGPLAADSIKGGFSLLKHHFKMAFRNMFGQKGYSFINIAGLAAGVAGGLFVLLYAADELSYDRWHDKADRIYRVAQNIHIADRVDPALPTSAVMAETLVRDFPQVEAAARINKVGAPLVTVGNENFRETDAYAADAALFEVFSFKLLRGDPATALSRPNQVVLARSTALKYFGAEDPLGRTIRIKGADYKVTGLAADVPRNSHFRFRILTSLASHLRPEDYTWQSGSCATYVLLQKGASPESLEAEFPAFARKYLFNGRSGNSAIKKWEYFLQPLTSIHLHSRLKIGEFEPNGDAATVTLFLVISVFILFSACVNFINLATARADRRAREVGIRKVVGSRRSQLVKQFLGESLLLTFIAFALAAVAVCVLFPAFRGLSGKDIPLVSLTRPGALGGFLLLAFLIGIGSGVYPALVLSSFKPLMTLKGPGRRGRAAILLRRGLIVIQFVISIGLFIGTTAVRRQMNLMMNFRLGYDKENVVVVSNARLLGDRARAFMDRLGGHASVQSVSVSSELPAREDTGSLRFVNPEGGQEGFVMMYGYCDRNFPATLRLEMASGRFFSREFPADDLGVVINEETARFLGWDEPLGKKIVMGNTAYPVVGVLKDFHVYSLHQNIPKMGFFLMDEAAPFRGGYIAARIAPGRTLDVLSFMKETWKSFSPPLPIDYSFLDEDYAALYRTEMRMKSVVSVFTSLAILISGLGLLGLASYMAERRRREIGIRKILGASTAGIAGLLSKEFLGLALVANIVAWPIASVAIRLWLKTFAYRIQTDVWIFASALGAVAILLFAATGTSIVRAAKRCPVDSIRHE